MLNILTTAMIGAATLAPVAPQQSVQEIFETMRARQLERWETVDNYTVLSKMQGIELPGISDSGAMEIPTHYQKHMIEGEPAFGLVPGNEYQVAVAQASEGGEYVTPEFFELYADASVMTADAFDAELAKSGMPMLPGMNYPGEMMRDNAPFLEASADAIREAEAGDFGRANAAASLQSMREMSESLSLVGREEVDGREAFHLRTEGLDRVLTRPGEEPKFTIQSVDMWIDAAEYVTLRMNMNGIVEGDGETTEVTMERHMQDYRRVGPLYESHRQVMRMTGLMGMMSEDERKQIEEARKQMEELEDMEEQLAQLPAAARGMVERQIAQARQQMEMLAGDGAFEMVTEVLRIEINTGPPPPGSRND